MKIRVELGDIVDQEVDAVIYSTNSGFLLSGGVGKTLVAKFGIDIQDKLSAAAKSQIVGAANPGAIVSCRLVSMPWKLLLHAVVTNDIYFTDPDIVRQVLIEAFDTCDQTYGIYTIAVSALGCGYGDLHHKQFISILKDVAEQYAQSDLRETVVVCNNIDYYNQMISAL